MNLSLSPAVRIPLKNGVAHYGDGVLSLRRFTKPDKGGAQFPVRGENAIDALVKLESELRIGEGVNRPQFQSLHSDYVAYWTREEASSSWSVTLALEPGGWPGKLSPFSIELHELSEIAAAIRKVKA